MTAITHKTTAARGLFSSRSGFILSAAGSAIGLGNIWSFPSFTASNGGAAFLVVYIILSFLLAYPALVAELLIGRYSQTHTVSALQNLSSNLWSRRVSIVVGAIALITAVLILSFYAIVAGWMLSFTLYPIAQTLHQPTISHWLTHDSLMRNGVFTCLFLLLTLAVVSGGVQQGIERWSRRLMPLLLILLIVLIACVITQPGAMQGIKVYLIPDVSRIFSPSLLIEAMGQAFFSMSLGVSTMMIYGSYLSKQENVPILALHVSWLNFLVAFLAGLLIIPCMYVATHYGVTIFDKHGGLVSSTTLVFQVLPALFSHMGATGNLLAVLFFILMSVAALTSSISMLEPPVAFLVDRYCLSRNTAAFWVTLLVLCISTLIITHFSLLFDFVVTLATQYAQPLLSMMFCIYAGWLWNRNKLLTEIRQGCPHIVQSWFWRIWPWYIKWVCPGLIIVLIVQKWL